MGGCRCVFRDCDTNTSRNRSISFFHFPTKEAKRYERWVEFAKAQHVAALPKSKQKNRVICARHFRDECFMNYKKNSLTRLALPTIWRLNKHTAIDYENNIEIGELITLNAPTQVHLIPPANFVCPLGFSENDDNQLLNRKMLEMGITPNNDSDNGNNTPTLKLSKKNTLTKMSIKKRPISQQDEIEINEQQQQQQQQQPKILNGQIWKKIGTKKLCTAENNCDDTASSDNNTIEMILTSDINSLLDSNYLTIEETMLSSINDNDANDPIKIQVEYNENYENGSATFSSAMSIKNNFIDSPDIHEEGDESYKNHSTTQMTNSNFNVNGIPTTMKQQKNNVNNNINNDTEITLMENIEFLKTTVADLSDDLSKATFELNMKKMEIEEYKKKCDNYIRLLQQQQQQQNRFNAKELQYQQELKKMNCTRRVFNKRYEELQKMNKQLLGKCEILEKLRCEQEERHAQKLHDQQKQIQLLQSTIAATKVTQMASESLITSSNSLPAAQVTQTLQISPPPSQSQSSLPIAAPLAPSIASVSVQIPSKAQLFNSVKRYISVAMASLLRMEMFGNAERPWKQDEKGIAVDIFRLGDTVYKYLVEEWRFRLPPIADARKWSTLNNSLNNENEL